MKVRIQKALAELGVASRRAIEQMILDGRITVNSRLVVELPCFVDLARDDIRVDSKPIRKRPQERIYLLVNKPRGVVCGQNDPQGRPAVMGLVHDLKQRVYCPGGLDDETTGLVILTNDGELTKRLTGGRSGIFSTYMAEIDGRLSEESMAALKKGMYFEDKKTPPVRVKVLSGTDAWSVLEIQAPEGRNPHIRRSLARLGHKLRRLKRTAIGPVTDRGVKIGHWRPLKDAEVAALMGEGR
jgi:pseudouridine synthase